MACHVAVAFVVGFMASHFELPELVWSSTPGQDLRDADLVRGCVGSSTRDCSRLPPHVACITANAMTCGFRAGSGR